MRKVVAVALSLAVQAAAFGAPLVHAHPDDHATEHHAGRTVHSHWSSHDQSDRSSDAPSLDADDHDRAVFMAAFVAVATSVPAAFAVTYGVVALPVPAERPAHRVIEVVHSHDPPFFRSLSSRAPPAFLS